MVWICFSCAYDNRQPLCQRTHAQTHTVANCSSHSDGRTLDGVAFHAHRMPYTKYSEGGFPEVSALASNITYT